MHFLYMNQCIFGIKSANIIKLLIKKKYFIYLDLKIIFLNQTNDTL